MYAPLASSTSSDVGKSFSVTYPGDSTVSGEQYTDTVSLAGHQVSFNWGEGILM